MVDIEATNEKLRTHAASSARPRGYKTTKPRVLYAAEGSVKVDVVMGRADFSAGEASRLLGTANGSVRGVLEAARSGGSAVGS